jgi:bifunctional DNA-binding transcriptional regulator/antitoxin component of YhaV-PrlF toxin-antitoxin module
MERWPGIRWNDRPISVESAVVDGEGQITIPTHICVALSLQPGDRIVFVEYVPCRFVIHAANRPATELKGMYGRHGGPALSIEQMNAVIEARGATAIRSDST